MEVAREFWGRLPLIYGQNLLFRLIWPYFSLELRGYGGGQGVLGATPANLRPKLAFSANLAVIFS